MKKRPRRSRRTRSPRNGTTAAASCWSCDVVRNKIVPLVALSYLVVSQFGSTSYGTTSLLRHLKDVEDLGQTALFQEMSDAATALAQNWSATAITYFQEMEDVANHSSSPSNTTTTDTQRKPHPSGEKVIDILQIGSNLRPDLMIAQQQSFGTHVSIRHVFNATEDDDDDQLCNSQLTNSNVYEISTFCRHGRQWGPSQYLMRYMRNSYGRPQWLEKKANPVGWLCAQKRPLHGLYKVIQMYRNHGSELPDHLILADDDTYYNMEEFLKQYVDDTPELPLVRAGCLVRTPIHLLNFTIPFGGYGVVFNRPSLETMMEPIQCPRHADVCARIQENQIGEKAVFRDGMALIDLIQAYASYQPYPDFLKGNWTTGYCLHSDW